MTNALPMRGPCKPEDPEKRRLRLRRYRADHPEKNREKNQAYRAANPEKQAAHKAVERAVKRGDISRQPCERCGSDKLVHAHHDDYSRHFDVIWLCPTHHRERHRELANDQ